MTETHRMQASHAPNVRIALALDIGGSHATAAAVDLEARRVAESTFVRHSICEDASAEEIIGEWVALVKSIPASFDAAVEPSKVLGIAIPGPFDYASGISYQEHKFRSLYGVNIGALLHVRLPGTKIVFGNDAAMFALGEQWGGVARGFRRVLGITLGTGLGAGFVVDGHVVQGDDPVTKENLWRQPYGVAAMEDYASARGIEKIYMDITDRYRGAEEIACLAREGDDKAILAWEEFGEHLSRILLPSVKSLRPDAIVLGGSISRSAALFTASMALPVTILPSELFDSAALLGAAYLAVYG